MSPIDLDDEDVLNFLRELAKQQVKYLLVGGFAVAFHGLIRATMDLDLWVKDDPANLEAFRKSLINLGVTALENTRSFELIPGFTQFQLGQNGFYIVLKTFPSSAFDTCYERGIQGTYRDVIFRVISRADLLKEKEATNRLKDQQDIEFLRKEENGG